MTLRTIPFAALARSGLAIAAGWAVVGAAAASPIYIGDDAPFGKALPYGAGSGNDRADLVGALTYIFFDNNYVAPAAGKYNIEEVNLVSDGAGTVTPFIAKYVGGSLDQGTSYQLLLKGDALTVAANSLVNQAFKVAGAAASVNLAAGDRIVSGFFQNGTVVMIDYINAPADPVGDYIRNGNAMPASVGSNFGAAADYFFTGTNYRFNVGLSAATVPEPMSLGLVGLGLAGLAASRRRTRA